MSFPMNDFGNTAKWLEVLVGTGNVSEKTMSSFKASCYAENDVAGLVTVNFNDLRETDIRVFADRRTARTVLLIREDQVVTNLLNPARPSQYLYAFIRDSVYGIQVYNGYGYLFSMDDPVAPSEQVEMRIVITGDTVNFYYNGTLIFSETPPEWAGFDLSHLYVYCATFATEYTTQTGTTTFYSEYVPPPQHSLTIMATVGGTTNPASGTYTYDEGANVQVQALPSSGYKFDHWELDGVNIGSVNPTIVTMNADHTLLAVFAEIPLPPTHTLTVDSTPIQGVPFTIEKVS
jgi:hypothetical protein